MTISSARTFLAVSLHADTQINQADQSLTELIAPGIPEIVNDGSDLYTYIGIPTTITTQTAAAPTYIFKFQASP